VLVLASILFGVAGFAIGELALVRHTVQPVVTVPPVSEPIVSESAEPVMAHAPSPTGDRADDERAERLRALARQTANATARAPTPEPSPSVPEPSRASEARPDWRVLARRTHVIVYTTGWCPVCRRAKAWLDANGISYDDRNVEASSEDARTLHRLNPRGSIPTFDVEGQVMVGFSESGFVSLVQSATRLSP
jgi:glutaredoxin 3